MQDDTERSHGQFIGLTEVVAVPGLPCWSVRVTVAHPDGPATGWAPQVFWSQAAAERWLHVVAGQPVRPAVHSCSASDEDRAFAAVRSSATGAPVVLGEPMTRVKAAGVAALLAAELRLSV